MSYIKVMTDDRYNKLFHVKIIPIIKISPELFGEMK